MLLLRLPNPNARPCFVRDVWFHDRPSQPDRSVINSRQSAADASSFFDPWIVKIISTLYVHSRSLGTHLNFLRTALNPSVAYNVIRRLNNPKLALGFFKFSISAFEFNHSVRTYEFLMKTLCRTGLEDAAKEVFDLMRSNGHFPDPSVVGYMASSFAKSANFDSAMGLLFQAHECGCRLNNAVYNNVLNLMVKNDRLIDAISFFRGSYFPSDTVTFNIVIKGLCRCGDVDRAFELFENMGSYGCTPDIVTYNTLIDGLCRAEKVDRALETLNEIRSRCVCLPDVWTYTPIVAAYCKMGKLQEASCIFEEMVAIGIRPSLVTYNVLIDGYGKAGQMALAVSIYVKMLDNSCSPDVVTFTSLIDGYCRSGLVDDAMKVWHEMGGKNILPNGYTFAIVINALCKENRLSEVFSLLVQLKQSNIVLQTFMYNPVIDGLCKVGNVDEANRIVAEMEGKGCLPDKFTFTILIIGHCMKGRMQEAIDLFNKMLDIDCTPDKITVNLLISFLLKAGMPHEANHIALTVSTMDFDVDLGSSKEIHSFKKNTDIPVAV